MRSLNPDMSGTMHVQVAAAIRDAINDGEFEPGQPIPSRAALVEHFGVALMTINRAITALKNEGLLIGRPGAGVFVRLRRDEPLPSEGNVYVVVMGQGGVFGAYLDRDRAEKAAASIEGVVTSMPILADYRKEVLRG